MGAGVGEDVSVSLGTADVGLIDILFVADVALAAAAVWVIGFRAGRRAE